MSNLQNIALVRKLYEEFYSKNNPSIADQFFTVDVKMNDPATPNIKGLAQVRETEIMYRKAFPNKTLKINEIFGTEDRVAVYWTAEGVQKGNLQGISPTGKNCTVTGISIFRITNGKISEIIQNWERLSLLEQLGVVEPLEALHPQANR